MDKSQLVKDMIAFINKSTSPFHAVIESKRMLLNNGFVELNMAEDWALQVGSKYFIIPFPSTIIAFTLGKDMFEHRLKIINSHTDSPGFKIKPNPEMVVENYVKLNTEVYGGPILNTWMDRLLSIAGKVALKSQHPMKPEIRYIDFKKPVLTIPNLAIHMNREINKGVELNKQKDVLPMIGQINEELEKENYLGKEIAKLLDVNVKDILDYDLFVYLAERAQLIGVNEEFISSPRLDNLSMVYASIISLIHSSNEDSINIAVCFDNEEIGSRTKQGADSLLLNNILERISLGLNKTMPQHYRMFEDSFVISADAAHAVHPNSPEKHDPTNKPCINKGVVIKLSSNQSYMTDCESTAIFQQICEKASVPYQKFVNRSDSVGGKTLGPISTSYLPIKGVDVGVPMLAMHSVRELMGTDDLYDMVKVFNCFYEI